MKRLKIKLNSVTYAMKAKDILKSKGIESIVRKNPKPKSGEGCGYTLVVKSAPENTVDILRFNGVEVIEAVWDK